MFLWFLRRTTHFLWTTEWERVMEGFENIWAGAPSMFTVCECGSRFDDCFIPVEDTPFSSYVLHPPIFIYIIYIYIYIITTKKSNSVSIFVFLSTFRGSLFRIGWGEGKKTKTEWWIKHFFFCQVSLFLNCNLCPWVAMHSEFLYFFFVSVFCVFLWELWKQKWFSLSVVYFQNSVFQLLRVSVFYLQILFLLIERNCHPPSPHI
jgi:hypothetical protein